MTTVEAKTLLDLYKHMLPYAQAFSEELATLSELDYARMCIKAKLDLTLHQVNVGLYGSILTDEQRYEILAKDIIAQHPFYALEALQEQIIEMELKAKAGDVVYIPDDVKK